MLRDHAAGVRSSRPQPWRWPHVRPCRQVHRRGRRPVGGGSRSHRRVRGAAARGEDHRSEDPVWTKRRRRRSCSSPSTPRRTWRRAPRSSPRWTPARRRGPGVGRRLRAGARADARVGPRRRALLTARSTARTVAAVATAAGNRLARDERREHLIRMGAELIRTPRLPRDVAQRARGGGRRLEGPALPLLPDQERLRRRRCCASRARSSRSGWSRTCRSRRPRDSTPGSTRSSPMSRSAPRLPGDRRGGRRTGRGDRGRARRRSPQTGEHAHRRRGQAGGRRARGDRGRPPSRPRSWATSRSPGRGVRWLAERELDATRSAIFCARACSQPMRRRPRSTALRGRRGRLALQLRLRHDAEGAAHERMDAAEVRVGAGLELFGVFHVTVPTHPFWISFVTR